MHLLVLKSCSFAGNSMHRIVDIDRLAIVQNFEVRFSFVVPHTSSFSLFPFELKKLVGAEEGALRMQDDRQLSTSSRQYG